MLVIPVSKNFKKSFPYITLSLIIINILIFLTFQLNEQEEYAEAVSYYRSADLLQLEVPLYKKYLERSNKPLPANLQGEELFWKMLQDDRFQYELDKQTLIQPGTPDSSDWSSKREIFENKLNQIFSHRFGYSPARKNYFAAFTCMFLHGGLMHLLGNMAFLWFVGSLLEVGLRRWYYYLIGYLLTGVAGSLAFGAVYPISQGPLVGASGAIAGLMGAYGLLYARTKIKVFYSLGFYFDYANVPGWILFPFWIGNEFFQLFTSSDSQVAYMAHIGGLISGAVLTFCFMLAHKKEREAAEELLEEEETLSQVPTLIEQGLEYLSELNMEQAREKMEEVLALEPRNQLALHHLFAIDKCNPTSEQFHKTATKLLQQLAALKNDGELEARFDEYKKLTGSPRLQPPLVLALAQTKMRSGSTAEAGRFLMILLKKQPQYPGVSSCLFNLGCTLKEQGNDGQAKKCFCLVCKQYPNTGVSRRAGEELKSL